MRVLLLVTDLERGGTPLRIARLARRLREVGVDATVGCLAPRGPVAEDLEADGVPTFGCGARNTRDVRALARLLTWVRRLRPTVLHATLTHANVAARLVGALQRIPVIGATATVEVERYWHRLLERATARFDRAHIVNSAAVADHVVRVFRLPREKVFVVPPSLDPPPCRMDRAAARAALAIPAGEFVVVWVGRFDPVKRLELVIGAAEALTDIPARFLLVGDGTDRPRVERLLRASSAANNVHLLGWHTDVGRVLSAADAFIFPSRTEGMPNAVLEAMACGVPVVASDIPILRELSGNGQMFLLVRRPTATDFAAALARLYADAALRAALSARSADWARTHLDPAATLAAVRGVYAHVCRGA